MAARQQGCVLRARDGKLLLKRAGAHLAAAMRAVEAGKYEAALASLRSSRTAAEMAMEPCDA
jgi:HEPN domain-containing protein